MQEKRTAIDYWYSIAVLGSRSLEIVDSMYSVLARELPPILSVVGERTCNLQCAHCTFQPERSSRSISNESGFSEAVAAVVRQMGPNPIVVHEGRIFRPWHLEWLKSIRTIRPDSAIGMIDNGTFLNHRGQITASGFQFDWLDISLDGPEEIHNRQRKSRDAFRIAIRGIKEARAFVLPGGRVTSLFTLTTINHDSILGACRALPVEVDEWHITTFSPTRAEIAGLETSDEEFAIAWRQVVSASKERKLFFRIYVNGDLAKLGRAVGKEKLLAAIENAKVADVALFFELEGVPVVYYPTSMVCGEEVILDADAHHRLPYSIGHTLNELRAGKSRAGEDLRKYTVGPIDCSTNLADHVERATFQWKREFGLQALAREIDLFITMREGR